MAKPYGLANQKLCNFQMLLNTGKYGEQGSEHSLELVGSVMDLTTGGRWFDHRFSQYSFRLMIVTATGFVPLSPLSVVSTMVMLESSQWLGKNSVRSTG